MAALPFQFTVPRRKVLGSVGRSATCVLLAITGLMAAAMTWSPLPDASAACAGASTSAASAAATTCQHTLTLFSTTADAAGVKDIPHAPRVALHTQGTVHAIQQTATSQTSDAGGNGNNGTTGSSGGTTGGPTPSPVTGGLPCQQSYMFVSNISMWSVPPGCYANIYYPDRSVYHAPGNFGFCNWWVLALHPNQPDLLYGSEYTRTSTPIPGAAVWFDPNVQGASSDGHWAQAVAVSPDHYWVLITEMNFSWRGGGWGRVDFRYIHVGPGVFFLR